jgi:TldD protein
LSEHFAEIGIEEALNLGASYVDIRFFITEDEQISVKDGKSERAEFSFGKGFGLRVVTDGGWGFSGSNSLDADEIRSAAGLAVKIAKASAQLKRRDVELCPCDTVEASYETKVKVDPFKVPEEDILDILLSSGSTIKTQSSRIKTSHGLFRAQRQRKYFASSEGSRIAQTIVWCGGGVYGVATRNGEVQRRSYPAFDGCFNTGGFEAFEAMDLNSNSERVGREAVELLNARGCPSETMTLLLGPEQMWLQIHESCGHPTELDRALGTEVDSAGASFLTPDMLNDFKYGSKEVNLVIDSTVEGGLGTFGFDDEGVPAKRAHLVKEGLFVGYQTSRDTAPRIGSDESTGSVRSMHGIDLPIIRMTNINLQPGNWRRDELIDDTKKGILIDTIRSWSIDDLRLNFQFGCEMGAMIEKGETREMVRNPTYTGITYEFWKGCDASSRDDWRMLGTPGCGKGRPGQSMYVGHGCGTTRFRNVRVGIL